MIGGGTQEESHSVRVEDFIGIHRPGQGVVIGFRENFKIRASLGDFIELSFPATGNWGEQKKSGAARKLVGFEVTGRGIARHGYPVLVHDERVGEVTSGTYAPFLQKNIGLCYVPAARAAVGTELAIDIRERKVPARVVPTPFYKRPDKTAPTHATTVTTT